MYQIHQMERNTFVTPIAQQTATYQDCAKTTIKDYGMPYTIMPVARAHGTTTYQDGTRTSLIESVISQRQNTFVNHGLPKIDTVGAPVPSIIRTPERQIELNELLCNAAKTDQTDITEMLIKLGAEVNHIDINKKTPLYHAYENKKFVQMKLLITHGADINKINIGYTILNRECLIPKSNPETIKMLMDTGADPNIKPTEKSADPALMALVTKNDIDNVLLLLSYSRTDINFQDGDGVSSFRVACSHGFGELTILLLNKGADPNIQGSVGYSGLMKSIICGKYGLASVLLTYDTIKLDLQDNNGNTALHHACKSKHDSIIHQLLLRGIDQTIKNKEGNIALEWCTTEESKFIFKNHEQTKNVRIINKKNLDTDVICFKIPSTCSSNIKSGFPGNYHQKWDKIFRCWKPFELIPKSEAVIMKCEYVDEKIAYHIITIDNEDVRVRFDSIIKEDGSKKLDMYDSV